MQMLDWDCWMGQNEADCSREDADSVVLVVVAVTIDGAVLGMVVAHCTNRTLWFGEPPASSCR